MNAAETPTYMPSGDFPDDDHQADQRSRLSPHYTIHPTARVEGSELGQWTEVGPGWSVLETTLGDYTYAAGCDGVIHYSRIGKFCSLASHVVINPGNHPMKRVTQHHLTYRRRQYDMGADDEAFFDGRRSAACWIGHDVWIGHGAMIMAGVKVGTGAVIGAGAVVTRDVVPYCIVAGVPAAPIGQRFSDDVAARLLASRWWNWSHDQLRDRMGDLVQIERFLEKYG
jgi:phosphonate metabolism protein (transferase hexapeptide repeat family)